MLAVSKSAGVPSAILAAITVVACSRESLDDACPDLAEGDLAVTELRGEGGHWIEVYAAADHPVEVAGLRVDLSKVDGSLVTTVLLRESLTMDDGSYAVLGFDTELYAPAALDLFACEVRVDRVIYRELRDDGTLALDGAIDPPSASANDDEAAYCFDPAGSPGEPNPPCP
jgi:hypothetical protein